MNWLAIEEFSKLSNDDGLEVGAHLIDLIAATRNIAYEEEDAKIKRELAEIYAAKGDNERAAKTLEKINLENTSRKVEPEEKAETYVQTAEYWFEEDDAVNAEKFINKAAHIIHLVKEPSV